MYVAIFMYYQMRFAVTKALGKSKVNHVHLKSRQRFLDRGNQKGNCLTQRNGITINSNDMQSGQTWITDLIATLAEPHHEVVGFDVAVQEISWVQIFNSADLQSRLLGGGIFLKSTIWSASSSTVFTPNFLEQKLNKSSKDGPRSSITMTLKSPSTPNHLRLGIPTRRQWVQMKLMLT